MKNTEIRQINPQEIKKLYQLVAQGEGLQLEFKRKAAFPDKIVREMIAFANTSGGILLVGVNDDGHISGLKYPEEESLVIRRSLKVHCTPPIYFKETFIPLTGKKYILQYEIPPSKKRPHFFHLSARKMETYIRVRDMSIKASREMTEIVRRAKHKRNIQFTYGVHESSLIRYLDQNENITLSQFQRLSGLDTLMAAKKLITLVLADVIRITPSEKGDLYSRIG